MGLKEAFQKAAVAAFNAAGNVKESVSYISVQENQTYSPSSSRTPSSSNTTYSGVEFLFANYTSRERTDESIKMTDMKALIPKESLTPTPKEGDLITRDSVDWEVKQVKVDPAEALWILQIRKP